MALEKSTGYTSGAHFAREVIAGLRASGVSTAKELPLSFYLYLPTRKAARACEPALVAQGLEVEIDKSAANDGTWLCLCHRTMKPTQKQLTGLGQIFLDLAQDHKGQFDGWETNPYKMAGGVETLLEVLINNLAARN